FRPPIEWLPRPRRREIAPLSQLPGSRAEPVDRAVVAAEGAAAQRAANSLRWVCQLFLKPAAECLGEEPRRGGFGEHLEQRVDARLDGPLAQQVGAEPVDRADVCLFELLERLV